MIYTVKPIKKMLLIFHNEIELALHPNQNWLVYEFGDVLYLSKGFFTLKLTYEQLNQYFREVEE